MPQIYFQKAHKSSKAHKAAYRVRADVAGIDRFPGQLRLVAALAHLAHLGGEVAYRVPAGPVRHHLPHQHGDDGGRAHVKVGHRERGRPHLHVHLQQLDEVLLGRGGRSIVPAVLVVRRLVGGGVLVPGIVGGPRAAVIAGRSGGRVRLGALQHADRREGGYRGRAGVPAAIPCGKVCQHERTVQLQRERKRDREELIV